MLLKLLRHLPGGEKLTQWTEAAPYLLAIIVAAHHAIFGHVDLMILGGYSLATWLTEKLSNEVASRTRQANRAIAMRFERLARRQIRQSIAWIESQAAAPEMLDPDAPVLQDSGEGIYLVGLIGGKEVGKSALVNALVGAPITDETSHGPGTETIVAYVHRSR